MADDREARINAALDKSEIYDVLMRYGRGVDQGDVEAVRSTYHPDAVDEHGNFFTGTGYELAEKVIPWVQEVFASTMHLLGNVFIELHGDWADVESYAVAHHRFVGDGGAWDIVGGGRYIDRFERRGGEWKIAHRRTAGFWNRVDLVGTEPPPALPTPPWKP